MHDSNIAVFTTKNVVLENKTITLVFHDEETWQFFSEGDTNTNKTAMVVSLGEILKMDSSLEEILDLPIGYKAYRKNKENNWIKEPYS